ncbi:MAG: hypothetical protein M1833_001894 [Piccolia ochrophora]|nr:MAG: hypothetical protein M1833_001894 [Piccolia ochrophora]
MASILSFDVLKTLASDTAGPRLGRLTCQGRNPMQTPHYVATTSRGVVPHVSPDVVKRHTAVRSVQIALEDFVEKAPKESPPIYDLARSGPNSSLRNFTAFGQDPIVVLTARRLPPVACPSSNTETSISISTSVGFRQLGVEDYVSAASKLQPDIVVGLADLVTDRKTSVQRRGKMGDRTSKWLRLLSDSLRDRRSSSTDALSSTSVIFAPVLPIDPTEQAYYLEDVSHELLDHIAGIVTYDGPSLAALPTDLKHLPTLALEDFTDPHQVLDRVAIGVDMISATFVGAATDQGVALDFSFHSSLDEPDSSRIVLKPLGQDMWLAKHAIDGSPLHPTCQCYTCRKHHKAYLQHLLGAKEMLGWVLLQLHNLQVLDEFFLAVRQSIDDGTFEARKSNFHLSYERCLPKTAGEGPRIRGYQYKSGPSEAKRNSSAYRSLDDASARLSEGLDENHPLNL